MALSNKSVVRLADYQPTPYAAPHTMISLDLDPQRTIVKAVTTFRPRHADAGPLRLAGDGLTLLGAELDGGTLSPGAFHADGTAFVLHAPPQREFALTIVTALAPDDNTELMGLYRSNGIFLTQCEAEGFRRITYAYDRPDVLTVYDVHLSLAADAEVALLSNGNLGTWHHADGRAHAHWHDPFPKPTYLFALAAGTLGAMRSTFVTMSGRTVRLGIYVEPGRETRAGYAMDVLKRAMRWDEERFGREYDLDEFNIVAVPHFNMGAMENKGLNIFNDRYILADPKLATDADYAGIEAVVAHEYLHNWTGNRITCRDWFQLCLKEGLTVFRDQEFTSDERSRPVKRVEDVRRLRMTQFVEDASPLRHAVRPSEYAEISNFYTATVYEKGAEIVRMILTTIGHAAFRRGMDAYFARYDGTAATVEDFLGCFEGIDVEGLMRWYGEAGTPTVTVEESFVDGLFSLRLTQRPAAGASHKPIPVRLAVFGTDGAIDLSQATVSGADLNGELIVLRDTPVTLKVPGLDALPTASPLREFSAPVHLDLPEIDQRDLATLERDDDYFNVWNSGQRLLIRWLTETYHGGSPDLCEISDAFASVVLDERHEASFRGLMLQLPSRNVIFEALAADVDPDKVELGYNHLARELGLNLAEQLREVRSGEPPAPDDIGAAAAGERALRNAALHLLTQSGDHEEADAQALHAVNMTDRLAALAALTAANVPSVDGALAAFHDQIEAEPLVLDKYFALQASRPDDGALARTQELTRHPRFSLDNPNRVRAVVGSFVRNATAFHHASGSGYRFVSEMAMSLDGRNSQLAARVLTAFLDYARFEAERRNTAKKVLGDLRAAARSSDVSDVLERLLKD